MANCEHEVSEINQDNDILSGIKDDALRAVLEEVIPKFELTPDGFVVENTTILSIMPLVYGSLSENEPIEDKNVISRFMGKIKPLVRIELYSRQKMPRRSLGGRKSIVVDSDSMINAVSYLYVKEKEEMMTKRPALAHKTLRKVAQLWGETPRSERFSEAAEKLEGKYTEVKKRIDLKREEYKRKPHFWREGINYFWNKYYPNDKEDFTKEEKVSCLNDSEIKELLGKLAYRQEKDEYVANPKKLDYEDFGIDCEAAEVIEFVRLANLGLSTKDISVDEFSIKRLEAGLTTVLAYLKKYPDIGNLGKLYELIRQTEKSE